MKKFLTILFLIAFGSFAVAEDVSKSSKAQDSIKKISGKDEKVKDTATSKIKENKKQLSSAQKRKLAKKQASKRNKILKQKQKEEKLIQIHTKHLEYKQNQLQEITGERPVNTIDTQKELKDDTTKE